jgi:phage virion morphogenesis protein
MAAPIEIEVRDGQLLSSLRRLAVEMSNPAPAMKLVGQLAQREVVRQYRLEKDPQDRKWKELSAATLKSRRNRNKSSIKILIDSGRLINSITAQPETANEVRVGTNVKYAAIHNFGAGARSSVKTHRRFGAIPQREFMGLTPRALDLIVQRLSDFVTRALRQSGLK